jgi:alanyl-tRNA synthetase
VVKAVSGLIGGGGGGRPDLAQAGGRYPAGIPAALAKAKEVIQTKLAMKS